LGIAADRAEPVLAWLQHKQALLVLDNCEHIVDSAAAMAERVLRAAPQVSVLATSREPLRLGGELSYRLRPFETPPVGEGIAAHEALAFAAVQLFAERAQAYCTNFVLNDSNAPAICEICRALDGLPLALELAAAQVEFMGVQGLARTLGNRFALLTHGWRTASQRQQSLRSTMDWSYSRLSEAERIALRRVAVFDGRFTMQAACAMASDKQFSSTDVIELIASLVDKSLISIDTVDNVAYLRLPETTRIYALEKLADCRESERLTPRHGECDDQSPPSARAFRRGLLFRGDMLGAPYQTCNRIANDSGRPGSSLLNAMR
jgi:predicted ATPase